MSKGQDGWIKPKISSEYHYFRERESLCGRYTQPRGVEPLDAFDEKIPVAEACSSCAKGCQRLHEKWVDLAPPGKRV